MQHGVRLSSFHERVRRNKVLRGPISGSRSGWVGIEPSAPKIYDVWRRKSGRREGKVNKNLREITVPGGKLRFVSPVAASLLPGLRSPPFPSAVRFRIIFHPPPEKSYYREQSRRIVRGREA